MIVDERPEGPRLLSYCTNVHPGESVADILHQLKLHAVPLRQRFPEEEIFGLGLRFGDAAVRELETDPKTFQHFSAFLAEHGFAAYTLNAFPQGSFHGQAAKAAVYEPDWSTESRLDYTIAAARLLSRLLPAGLNLGTISTLPLGAGQISAEHRALCTRNLLTLAGSLAGLHESSGNRILVCLEPEPLCTIETIPQLLEYFQDDLLSQARNLPEIGGQTGEEQVIHHLGICYDTCHQAVEFEEASYNCERIRRQGITIGKIQLANAIELERPAENPEGMRMLRQFDEPRFLHQVVGRSRNGALTRFKDLGPFLEAMDSGLDSALETVRCHFHVPVHVEDRFPLGTTSDHLLEILSRQRAIPDTSHFEVETYTLGLIPGQPTGTADLIDDLEAEIRFAHAQLTAT